MQRGCTTPPLLSRLMRGRQGEMAPDLGGPQDGPAKAADRASPPGRPGLGELKPDAGKASLQLPDSLPGCSRTFRLSAFQGGHPTPWHSCGFEPLGTSTLGLSTHVLLMMYHGQLILMTKLTSLLPALNALGWTSLIHSAGWRGESTGLFSLWT